MPVKERVKEGVEKIATEGRGVDERVTALVRDDYTQTLANCEKTGSSLKLATSQTLEGVEAGLGKAGRSSHALLAKCADAISDATHEASRRSLAAAQEKSEAAKETLDQALEKTGQTIDSVDEKLKEKFAVTHAALHQTLEREKAWLHEAGEAISEYSRHKAEDLDETARAAFHEASERTKGHIRSLEQSTEEHGKKLLHHSQTKAQAWLHSLAEKVAPKD